MRFGPPPFALMETWMRRSAIHGKAAMLCSYDDLLDVIRELLSLVPVNQAWYRAEYPYVDRVGESESVHFCKHGYFNGCRPFFDGWNGRRPPVSFKELKVELSPRVGRKQLFIEIETQAFLSFVRNIISFVDVDEVWYQSRYPNVAELIAAGEVSSAREHYTTSGYFEGLLPADVRVDEPWYTGRYAHVRNGLRQGVAPSAQEHFFRIGYSEGCQPTA